MRTWERISHVMVGLVEGADVSPFSPRLVSLLQFNKVSQQKLQESNPSCRGIGDNCLEGN
ncbi:hypothetical protein I7I52_03055 [Histoplasma capsulatum]|uniref:Uncharacterized protein n=1 Tax=Ajellomyces capsulatus TaxID=5037 RepID=A0A8H8D8G6_AJECA|nr:hypothetical protein I7I52_03055 [Histoplasma capsulatum]